MSPIDSLHFHDDDAAREYLESVRWPDGPVCPHCGSLGDHYRLEGTGGPKGTMARKGLLKCQDCREQFSVTVGTVFEDSKIPLHKWLMAAYLMCSSKKGISSRQLQRTLGFKSYKTAWFLSHRLRLAMATPSAGPVMGSGGGVVEADETYVGRKRGRKVKAGPGHKHMVFALVERGGKARSIHITGKTFPGIKRVLKKNVSPDARLATDEARMYRGVARQFAEHLTVNHSKDEYVRGDASTNTIESFFSVFKRGLTGVYQHMSQEHLHRYLAEFDHRFNTRASLGFDDEERTRIALKGIEGKRLTYE